MSGRSHAPPGAPSREEPETAYREAYGSYRPFQERGSAVTWVETDVDDWTIAYGFASRDGALELAELHVLPTRDNEEERGWNFLHRGRRPNEWSGDVSLVPEGGLTVTALRDMLALNDASRVALSAVPKPHDYLAKRGFVSADRRPTRPPAARTRHSDEKLALGAIFYQRAAKLGLSVPDYVAEELTRRGFKCARDSVRNLVTSMRDRGFLANAAKRGRASGEATEKAVAIAHSYHKRTERQSSHDESSVAWASRRDAQASEVRPALDSPPLRA
jgi:hypothetical protein